MPNGLQSQPRKGEVLTGTPERLHEAVDRGIGLHEWVEGVPFGGHWLVICRCGCPGPFVLSLEDARGIQCGVALAWREGSARLAVCGERDRLALAGRV